MDTIELIARAVVISNNKLLLCRKVGDPWYFLPGGHVEFGEETKTALAREIKEELGVEGTVGEFIGIVENIFNQEGNERHEISKLVSPLRHEISKLVSPLRHEINLVFEVTIEENNFSSQEDHIEFAWIDKAKLQEEQIYPVALKHSILQWIEDQKLFWANSVISK